MDRICIERNRTRAATEKACAATDGPLGPFRKSASRRDICEGARRSRWFRTPAEHDSRPPRFAPSPPAGKRRQNPSVAYACQRSWRWRRVRRK
eukprot:4312807-Pleurochrysis_carterae.AAC.1